MWKTGVVVDLAILALAILAATAIAWSVIGFNRRSRRRSRDKGARVAAELGLTFGDRATGQRAGRPVELWWSHRASETLNPRPVTICAARFHQTASSAEG